MAEPMRGAVVTTLWLAVNLLAGCGDECALIERRCAGGQVVEECVFLGDGVPNRNVWSDEGTRCVGDAICVDLEADGVQGATCSLSGQLDPRCGAAQRGAACLADGTLLVCDQGYASYQETCAGACITLASGAAFCAARPDPAAACAGAQGSECDGDLLVLCRDGYVTEELPCGVGATCVEHAAGFTAPTGYCTGPQACTGPDSVACVDDGRMTGCIDGRSVDVTCTGDTECATYSADPRDPAIYVSLCEERH